MLKCLRVLSPEIFSIAALALAFVLLLLLFCVRFAFFCLLFGIWWQVYIDDQIPSRVKTF